MNSLLKIVLITLGIFTFGSVANEVEISDGDFLLPYLEELQRDASPGMIQSVLKRTSEDLDEVHMTHGLWLRNVKLRSPSWNKVNEFYIKKGIKHRDDISGEVLKLFRIKLMNDMPLEKRATLEAEQAKRHKTMGSYAKLTDVCSKFMSKNKKKISACLQRRKDFEFVIQEDGSIKIATKIGDKKVACLVKIFKDVKFEDSNFHSETDAVFINSKECRLMPYWKMLLD